MTVESATTSLASMTRAEAFYRVEPPDYIDRVQRHGMTPQWRARITEWYAQLATSFKLSDGTTCMAVNFLDRYLAATSCSGVSFQLVAVAALFLACKIEEPRPITTSDFAALSEGVFAPEDVRLMELELLCALGWRINPPTTSGFCALLCELLPDTARCWYNAKQRR